jgi:glycosyltransferase involved in cell wall biosynthesis
VRIAHVITDLEVGGAQIMLQRLVARLQASGVENSVISLSRAGSQPAEVTRNGVTLHHLDMTPNRPSASAFFRLNRLLAAFGPDVVHTWMYHADLLGGIAARLSRVAPVVWGIHHTPCASEPLKRVTRFIMRVNSALSSVVPARIVCCAHASQTAHRALGYAADRMVVIPNGFDTDAFCPDPTARTSVRCELGVGPETPLIGLMARFHPQKDHRTFVLSAAHLMQQSPAVHFVLAGRGVDARSPTLRKWVDATGAPDRFHLLGARSDMPRLMAACDIVSTSSAHGEGLPLVLGEAMSCGVPCVATDVGDSGLIVGDSGRVVAPADAAALAAAWASMLALTTDQRRQLGQRARERVVRKYPLATYVQDHVALYEGLRRRGNGTRRP